MARRKKRPPASPNVVIQLLELQMSTMQHCQALKAITGLLGERKVEAAIARLDQAVSALHAVVRGQAVGQTMKCPKCDTEQDVVAWVDEKKCQHCGEELGLP